MAACSDASQPFQGKFSLISNLKFPRHSLRPFPFVLLLLHLMLRPQQSVLSAQQPSLQWILLGSGAVVAAPSCPTSCRVQTRLEKPSPCRPHTKGRQRRPPVFTQSYFASCNNTRETKWFFCFPWASKTAPQQPKLTDLLVVMAVQE